MRSVAWLLIGGVAAALGVSSAFRVRGALEWEREREFRAAPMRAAVPVKASGRL